MSVVVTPTLAMSKTDMPEARNAMALGAVEMGRQKAKEQWRVEGIIRYKGFRCKSRANLLKEKHRMNSTSTFVIS